MKITKSSCNRLVRSQMIVRICLRSKPVWELLRLAIPFSEKQRCSHQVFRAEELLAEAEETCVKRISMCCFDTRHCTSYVFRHKIFTISEDTNIYLRCKALEATPNTTWKVFQISRISAAHLFSHFHLPDFKMSKYKTWICIIADR